MEKPEWFQDGNMIYTLKDTPHGKANGTMITVNLQPRDFAEEALIASDVREKIRNFEEMRAALLDRILNCCEPDGAPDERAFKMCKRCERDWAILGKLQEVRR